MSAPEDFPGFRTLLKQTARKCEAIIDRENLDDSSKNELLAIPRKLEAGERRFESKLFVLLIFGPLKSGKSTLTNCLARQLVSPTQLGVSSTKRPSIVLASDVKAPAAAQYFEADRTPHKRLERFEQLMDCLRGVEDFAGIKAEIEKKEVAFAAVPLRLAQAAQIGVKEPLITAITVPAKPAPEAGIAENAGTNLIVTVPTDPFLESGMAIIDSPGLDDPATAGLETHEKTALEWAMSNADLCLLLHSSLAAPNERMLHFVADVLTKASSPPVLVVQNRFDARVWRQQALVDNENQRQRDETRKHVQKHLGAHAAKLVPATFVANLGLAFDNIFNPGEVDSKRAADLGMHDNLVILEDQIHDLLKRERGRLKQLGCVHRIEEQIADEGACVTVVTTVRGRANDIKLRFGKEQEQLCDLQKRVAAASWPVSYWEDKVKTVVDTAGGEWLTKAATKFESTRNAIQAELGQGKISLVLLNINLLTAAKVNPFLETLNAQIEKAVNQDFNVDGAFGKRLADCVNDIVIQQTAAIQSDVDGCMAILSLEHVNSPEQVTPPYLPPAGFEKAKAELVKGHFLDFLPIIGRYSTQDAIDHLNGQEKALRRFGQTTNEQYGRRVAEFVEKRLREFRELCVQHLKGQDAAHAERWRQENEQADAALAACDRLSEELASLKKAAVLFPKQ